MSWDSQYVVANQVIIEGQNDGMFVYAGTPATGNLIVSAAAQAGTDPYGNTYPEGLSVTQGVIAGTLITGGQIVAGSLSAGSIGSSVLVACDFQGGTMEETAITFDAAGGRLLLYATTTVSQTFNSSGTYSVPAGITSVKAEAWGGGAGGWGGLSNAAGGGGGEYAAEATLAVTPLETLTVTVGGGGAGATGFGAPGSGGDTIIKRSTTALVTAHGGGIGNAQGSVAALGGTGSTNSTHFNGGGSPLSAQDIPDGGSGGGGSGGSSSAGNAGAQGATSGGFAGGAGGAAVTGGGGGGNGGAGSGASGVAGSAGSAPGGGGGAGGLGIQSGSAGGAGAAGRVKITYVSSQTLIGAIAPAAGTDASGNAFPEGLAGIQQGVDYAVLAPNGSHAALLFGTAGNAADSNLYRAAGGGLQTDNNMLIAGSMIKTGSTWQTPTLGANWAVGANSGGFLNVRYRLDAEDNLIIQGAAHSTSNAPAATIFTLAAGWRPAASWRGPGAIQNRSGTTTVCYLEVDSGGAVSVSPNLAATAQDVYFMAEIPMGNQA